MTDDIEMEEEKAQAGTLSCEHSASEDPWKIQKSKSNQTRKPEAQGKKDLKLDMPI